MGLVETWREALALLAVRPDAFADGRWTATLTSGVTATFTLDGEGVAVAVKLLDHWPELTIIPTARALSTRDAIDTGDPWLDKRTILGASEQAGRFDAALRKSLVILMDRGVTVSAGAVRLSAASSAALEPSAILDVIGQMGSLARAFVRMTAADNDAAVVKIAIGDPDPRVRHAFARLARDPALLAAAQRHANARDAATTDAFDALVRHLGDFELPADIRVQAALRLLNHHPRDPLLGIPKASWRGLDTHLIAAAFDKQLTRTGGPSRPTLAVIARHLLDICDSAEIAQLPKIVAELALETTKVPLADADRELVMACLAHRADDVRAQAGRRFVLETPLYALHDHLATRGREWTAAMKSTLVERVHNELGRDDVTAAVTLLVLDMVMSTALLTQMPSLYARTLIGRTSGMNDPLVLRLLVAMLGHAEPEVRRHAVSELLLSPIAPRLIAAAMPMDAHEVFARLAPPFLQRGPNSELLAVLLDSVSPREAPLRDNELVVAYLEALAAAGDGRQTDIVANQLESPYDDVVRAAVKTLGAIGNEHALPRLEPFSKGFFRSADLKAMAKDAMLAIIARHGDGQGGLALAERDDSVGRLSVTDPPK